MPNKRAGCFFNICQRFVMLLSLYAEQKTDILTMNMVETTKLSTKMGVYATIN